MSSVKRSSSGVVTYSRKNVRTVVTKTAVSTPKSPEQKKRSFWDFSASSDEDELVREVRSPSMIISENALKRKASEFADPREKKLSAASPNITKSSHSISNSPMKSTFVQQEGQSSDLPQRITPQKSNLVQRGGIKNTSPVATRTRRQTPQPVPVPPPPTTPKSKAQPERRTSLPPKTPPEQTTTPRRILSRVHSPLSTPPSSSKSHSQPALPASPKQRTRSGPAKRSLTFDGTASPRMTPKQEKTWESIEMIDDTSFSPMRRRLVDKLREEASKSPERTRVFSPSHSQLSDSQLSRDDILETEISRVLEYTAPSVMVEDRPLRKESQFDSQGTYLSRSRSFLAETCETQASMDIPGLDQLWQVEEKVLHEVEEEDLDPGVKSWHELKRGGEDKRLLDEMEDLIEQCKVGGRIGLRRSSVLQIVDRILKDATWGKKLKAWGLLSTFIHDVTDADKDPILLTLTLLAINLIPKPIPSTITEAVFRFCLAALKESRDLLQLSSLRSMSVSKILKSELQSLPARTKDVKTLPEVLSARQLVDNTLIDLVVTDIRPIFICLAKFHEILSWRELKSIAGCLEQSTQGRNISGIAQTDLNGLDSVLQRCIQDFNTEADSQKATLGLLRVSINLTNSNGEVCEALNRDTSLVTALTDIITTDPEHYSHAYHQEKDAQTVASAEDAPEQEEREANFDLLLLSLGLMINFVQESGKVKEMVLSTDLPGQINLLFEKLIARDGSANHALGYLALLLAHLIIPTQSGKGLVVKKESRNWVERLLDDFVGIHRVVESQSREEIERREVEGMAKEVENVLILLRRQGISK